MMGDVSIESKTSKWLCVQADAPTTSDSQQLHIQRDGDIASIRIDATGYWYVPLATLRTVVEMLEAGDV